MRPLRCSLLALFVCCAAGLLQAEEQTVNYRIVGLSGPERKDDFPRTISVIPEVALAVYEFEQNNCALRFEPEKLIPPGPPKKKIDRSPEKLLEALNALIRKASSHTFSLTVPSTTPEDKLAKVEIKVGLLDCKGCRFCAYEAVAKVDGVDHARVGGDTVTAWVDPAKTNQAALEDALVKNKVVVPGNPNSLPAWR